MWDGGRTAVNEEQRNEMASRQGFLAALDQSGGSTPKALKLYGISEDAYTGDEQMFDLIHQMRERLMASPSFTGDKVLATILFEQTMDRDINGGPGAQRLRKRRTAHEADDEPRLAVGARRRARHLRYQDALVH
jgi:fructose-bisphosphate aldolase, class I